MRTLVPALLAFLAFSATSVPALAQDIINTTSTKHMSDVFKTEGYAYEVDSDGDIVWKLEGYKTLILIAKDGESITFRANFASDNTTNEKVAAWNRSKRYSKSYLDDDNDPVLQLDLDLAGGITRARLNDFLKTCRASLVTWINEVVR